MSAEASSSKAPRLYSRGPYRKPKKDQNDNLYRNKLHTPEDFSNKDCRELYYYLYQVRNDIKSKFTISYNRSKVIENLQGLLDYLKKQINRIEPPPKPDQKKITELEKQLKDKDEQIQKLTRELAERDNLTSTLEAFPDFSEFPEFNSDNFLAYGSTPDHCYT